MTLRDVSVGQTVKVTRLNGDGPVKRRIMDMGITKGVEVYVRKVAPLGDPVYRRSDEKSAEQKRIITINLEGQKYKNIYEELKHCGNISD